jgi:hypothetical protein
MRGVGVSPVSECLSQMEAACSVEKIEGFPTWILPDGSKARDALRLCGD